ncbi:MAG: HAMP domain-containing sensor histidine kinase [Planctomycetota bacterium]|nr:HAMP domain-containing sensor histidine kinase [Planctomycetota bacterium]
MTRSYLPLRLKLTLWSVGVFFVTLSILYLGIWFFAKSRASLDVEGDVRAKLATAIEKLSDPETQLKSQVEIDAIARSLSTSPLSRRFSVRLWTEEGSLYSSSGDDESLREVPFAHPEDVREAHVDNRRVKVADGAEMNLRVATREFTTPSGLKLYAELATPAAASDEDVIALGNFALYILPVGLLAAAVAAWIMAGRVVSPIRRLAKAARAVSPSTLEGPIDVEPGDTEIARLQHELNDAFGRLEKAYREQGSFISNVSHELKTPIAVLLSQAQVLKQEERSPSEYRRFLAVVEDEMRGLGRLVESFLVLARVGHGKNLVRQERLTVNDVVLEAAEHCAPLSRHHEVPLVTLLHLSDDGEQEPEIEGDPELLRTLFENLLRNALRFSPSGEPVDLRVTCTKDRASILVRDRGPGIAREHIDRVFERFYTVTDAEVGGRGSGLGLAIAKSIAELHNGTISVHNCVDRGCEFEVLLPLSKPLPVVELPEAVPDAASTAVEGVVADAPSVPESIPESDLPTRELTPRRPSPTLPPQLEGLSATE